MVSFHNVGGIAIGFGLTVFTTIRTDYMGLLFKCEGELSSSVYRLDCNPVGDVCMSKLITSQGCPRSENGRSMTFEGPLLS